MLLAKLNPLHEPLNAARSAIKYDAVHRLFLPVSPIRDLPKQIRIVRSSKLNSGIRRAERYYAPATPNAHPKLKI